MTEVYENGHQKWNVEYDEVINTNNFDDLNVVTRFCFEEIFSVFDVLYVDQLRRVLRKKFQFKSWRDVDNCIYEMVRENRIVITEDGLLMTLVAYFDIMHITAFDRSALVRRDTVRKIDKNTMKKRGVDIGTIDCMWIVSDMFPNVHRLSVENSPLWNISFCANATEKAPFRIYQCAKFNRGEEAAQAILMKNRFEDMKSDKVFWEDKSVRDTFRQIVVLDDEDKLNLVPTDCAVNIVIVLDEKEQKKYRILRAFNSEQAWRNVK